MLPNPPATALVASGSLPPGLLRTPRGLLTDPVRTLILVKARQAGLTLRGVSLRLGRAHGYMSVYLTRGSPAELPTEIRGKLAAMLDVNEDRLIQRAFGACKPDSLDEQQQFTPSVPLFAENERLTDPTQAKRQIVRPLATSAYLEGMVAVSITLMDTDRIRIGDTVYLQQMTPMAGDLIAVINADGFLQNVDEALTIDPCGYDGQFKILWWDQPPDMPFITDPGSTLRKVVAIIPR